MPEGPETYRDARRIQRAIGGRRMTEVWFAFDELEPWQETLQGRKLKRARTLGKAILLEFADGTTIYTHNQLYGRWMFSDPDRRPDTNRQLRLALSSTDRSALLYSASEIEVLAPGELDDHPFVRRAGLDVLSSGADRDDIAEWITQDRFARRRLGHLLLDQSFLAGVGNYLRSEILFGAGLGPRCRIGELDGGQVRALAEAVHDLMWRAVETGGITNDPVRSRRLKEAGWKRREYRHYVFGRDGQACFECDTEIGKTRVDNRRLYYCPSCQRA
jgi:endonuclease-8